jgi:hypothetical protein
MRGRLALGFLGGGTAWILHLAASYFLVSVGCARGWRPLGVLLGAVTLLGVAGAVAAGVAAGRGGRTPAPEGATGGDPGESARFVAGVGMRLAALFAFMILVAGLAPLALLTCPSGPSVRRVPAVPGASPEALMTRLRPAPVLPERRAARAGPGRARGGPPIRAGTIDYGVGVGRVSEAGAGSRSRSGSGLLSRATVATWQGSGPKTTQGETT